MYLIGKGTETSAYTVKLAVMSETGDFDGAKFVVMKIKEDNSREIEVHYNK